MFIKDRETIGDASESAILRWCDELAQQTAAESSFQWRFLHTKAVNIPFSSQTKFAATVYTMIQPTTEAFFQLTLKGAF